MLLVLRGSIAFVQALSLYVLISTLLACSVRITVVEYILLGTDTPKLCLAYHHACQLTMKP